mgnify:CR=1 FL=1
MMMMMMMMIILMMKIMIKVVINSAYLTQLTATGQLKSALTSKFGSKSGESSSRTPRETTPSKLSSSTSSAEDDFVTRPIVLHMWPTMYDEDISSLEALVLSYGLNARGYNVELGRDDVVMDLSLFEGPNRPFYKEWFVGREHYTYVANAESIGPIVLSLLCFPTSSGVRKLATIVRTTSGEERYLLLIPPKLSSSANAKSMLKLFQKSSMRYGPVSFTKVDSSEFEKNLVEFERHSVVTTYKIGVVYCLPGQKSEDEMLANVSHSDRFEQFMKFIGERVTLKGFSGFRGGLDVKNGTTGEESLYKQFHGNEIMYHISTLLPFNPNDQQHLERKRHIGNDVVVIIFFDDPSGTQKWSPEWVHSNVNQVFVVVRPMLEQDGSIKYFVNIAHKKGVPPYNPFLPNPPLITPDYEGREFFLKKVINAERAAMLAPVYRDKFDRSRLQLLTSYVAPVLGNK